MNEYKLLIWGREFDLDVVYELYDDEELTDTQQDTVLNIEKVSFDDPESRAKIVEYISNDYPDIETDVSDVNLFKYLIPKTIYVPQDDTRIFALLFNYKFDEEHGFALVYENETLIDLGSEDIIL